MNCKLTALALMAVVGLSATAQESSARATSTAYDKAGAHNWFITFSGGASVLGNGTNDKANFKERITFTPSLSLGKWHNPYFATRLKLEAGEAKSFMQANPMAVNKHYFAGAHYDFLFDLVNFFSAEPGKCPVSFSPFVGAGYEYKFDSSKDFKNVHAATANVGLQLGVRLARRVDLVVEGQATWNGLQLSKSYPTSFANNLRYTASAGLNFRLGKVGFTAVTPLDEALVARLKKRIGDLEAENAELSKRPVDCPEVVATPVVAQPSRFLAEKSILFAHGKSAVSKDQLITIFDASEFVKNHEGELVVTGYMQKNESRFKGLAERRAGEVARILVNEYGVDSSKITIEYKDANEAPFAGTAQAWNRVVVIRSK